MIILSLFILRHGCTEANTKGIIQGHASEPLNDQGRKEAQLVGDRLSMFEFNYINSSDLIRAKETAQIISSRMEKIKPVITVFSEALRERKFGVLEGQSVKLRSKLAAELNQSIWEFTPEGGEALPELQQRTAQVFEQLCSKFCDEIISDVEISGQHKMPYKSLNNDFCKQNDQKLPPSEIDGRILIITHGGLIRELFRYLWEKYGLKIMPKTIDKRTFLKISPNTGLSEILVYMKKGQDGNCQICSMVCTMLNSCSHLNNEFLKSDSDSDSGV